MNTAMDQIVWHWISNMN